jgi:FtsH-binding integral membrane protein
MFNEKSEFLDQSTLIDVDSTVVSSVLKRVYLWMTFALVITGLTAMYVVKSQAILELIYSSQYSIMVLFLVQLGVVWLLSSCIHKLSFAVATLLFILYSVLTGIVFSSIFFVYTLGSIANVFLITAGTFAAVSCFGLLTKKDLSNWGTYLFMGVIGLIIASLVNWFFKSEMLYWISSYIGVAIFVGLTAYDTQRIKAMVQEGSMEGEVATNRIALMGALSLYLDFINLFLYLLRIFGRRK